MAQINFAKLNLKENSNLIKLNWNDQEIEIKEYLPIEKKSEIIQRIVDLSLDDDNSFANPIRLEINTVLEIIFAYTNIEFTEEEKENGLALYDLIISNGLWEAIYEIMKQYRDIKDIFLGVEKTVNEINRHKDSVLGILEAVNQDYKDLQFDMNTITQTLGDSESLTLLKDIVTKLG